MYPSHVVWQNFWSRKWVRFFILQVGTQSHKGITFVTPCYERTTKNELWCYHSALMIVFSHLWSALYCKRYFCHETTPVKAQSNTPRRDNYYPCYWALWPIKQTNNISTESQNRSFSCIWFYFECQHHSYHCVSSKSLLAFTNLRYFNSKLECFGRQKGKNLTGFPFFRYLKCTF